MDERGLFFPDFRVLELRIVELSNGNLLDDYGSHESVNDGSTQGPGYTVLSLAGTVVLTGVHETQEAMKPAKYPVLVTMASLPRDNGGFAFIYMTGEGGTPTH